MRGKRQWLAFIRDLFFWIGVAAAAASICVVCAGNTLLINRLERQTVPLSWLLAGLAMVALMVAEQFHLLVPPTRQTARDRTKLTPGELSGNAVTQTATETYAEVFSHGT